MSIKPDFKMADVRKHIVNERRKVDEAIKMRLRRVGESFVKDARIIKTYIDQTGNLRSSIGYLILKDGLVIDENFEKSSKGTDRESGLKNGIAYAKLEVKDFNIGFVLIVVAGEDYAASVESKGRDVLTGSSLIAKVNLKRNIDELQAKLNR